MKSKKAPKPKWYADLVGKVVYVPLPAGGFGRAVVAALDPGNGRLPIVLLYGFGPRLPTPREEATELRAERSCFISAAVSEGVRDGDWVVGTALPTFEASAWPVPIFSLFLSRGSDDPMCRLTKPQAPRVDGNSGQTADTVPRVVNRYPSGGLADSAYFENVLEMAIDQGWTGRRPIPGLPKVPMRLWDKDVEEAAERLED